jgi:hypothetical protein
MVGLITVFVIFFSAKNNKKEHKYFEKRAKENKQAFKIEKQEF